MIFGTFLTWKKVRTAPKSLADFSRHPISILKPLKGVDEGLRENIESFFRIDYPLFEIIFCIADNDDPALPLVREMMAKYSEVDARIYMGESRVGPNPKVNNMLSGYEDAKYDLVLISDSNVRVRSDYLKRLVPNAIGEDIGLVTAIVAGVGAKSFGGIMEAASLNGFVARGMAMAFFAGKPCVVGKSMLFSRKAAARFGGLRILGRYLAEDFMAGEAMGQLGLKVILTQDPVEQYIGKYTVSQYWSRHLRWGRIRKAQAPLIFPFELLQNAFCVGAIGAIAIPALVQISTFIFLCVHLGIWAICDISLQRKLSRTRLSWRNFVHWAARELLALPLHLQICMNNTVNWRGQKLRLGVGGVIE